MLNYQRVTLVCSPQLGPLNPRGPGGSLDPVLSHWQHALPQAWLCSGSQVPSWEQRHNSVAQKLITYLSTWIYGSTICKLFKYFKSTALQSERGVKVLMLEWIETNSDQVINHYIPWHCVPNTFWLIQYFRELYKVGPPSYKLVHKPRSSRSPIPHQPKTSKRPDPADQAMNQENIAVFRALYHHQIRDLLIWQCVKTLYPCSSHQNSW